MARTPTRAAPTRAAAAEKIAAARAAATRAAPTRAAPTRAAPAAGLPAYVQHLMAAGASGASEQPQIALPRISQADIRSAPTARQTQPLPPSAGRAVPPALARGIGATQQAAAASRMPAKTGAPLPSGMGMGGGQPTPPSRTGGGQPIMAGGAGGMKKGGKVKKMAKGGSVSSASKRGDGCATKGKTKGRFV